MRSRWYLLLPVLLSCWSEEPPKIVYEVQDEFKPYVTAFLAEAEKRGHTLTIDNLILKYGDTMSSTACGRCNTVSGTAQKIITINVNPCWVNSEGLESLVFHELGHCILGRQHTSDMLPNGAHKSIMNPGDLVLYSPCIYQIGESECNKLYRRSYYIDELFDENTPVPAWAK